MRSQSRAAWRRSVGRIFLVLVACAAGIQSAAAVTYVQLDYNFELESRARNTAFIELFDDRPLTRDNFMQYVNGGKFDGTIMHRLARNFVVQGGGFYPEFVAEPFPVAVSLDPTAKVDLDGNPQTSNPTVNNEFGILPKRTNARGTLAMAKVGGNPNSATNEWFVNLGNNAGTAPNGLDFQNGGFTVFAQVRGDGMSLFDGMNQMQIGNLNPDTNNNGVRDGGPFSNSATDGIPMYTSVNAQNQLVSNLVELERAKSIDYFGAGQSTTVPTAGIAFTARDAFFDTGTGFFGAGGGGFRVGPGRTLGIREGFATGRLVTNEGTLAPGLQLGSATIGSLDQKATGKLEIQLRGTTLSTGYDRLIVSGQAKLAGTLDVALLGDFDPSAGNSFTVLTAQSILGNFSDIVLPALDPGLVWNTQVGAKSIVLTVAAADFTRDGIVDAADYTMWRDTRGANVTAYSGADGNGDGTVNDADYGIWKSNFGRTSGIAAASVSGTGPGGLSAVAVPEPSSVALLLVAIFGAAGNRRRRA